jgi:hypothetical protein
MAYGTVNADLMTTSDGVSSSGTYGFKNRIINGAMVIDQRNAGASVTPSSSPTYLVDRWYGSFSQASKLTYGQNYNSITPPTGYINYLGIKVAATATVGATDYFEFGQKIEGLNLTDLNWGTANASTVTLSFYVYSNTTGTFGGVIRNSADNRSYPFTYTINSATTWEQKTITIAGDTSGTWLKTNGIGLQLIWSVGTGSTYLGTAGAWAGALYGGATGQTSLMGSTSNYLYITGVQLEKGSTATSFDYRPYGTELQLCQRYYLLVVSGTGRDVSMSYYYNGGQMGGNISFPVQMRTYPSLTSTSGTDYYANYSNNTIDFMNVIVDGGAASLISGSWYNTAQASGTQGYVGFVRSNNASTFAAWSAEL